MISRIAGALLASSLIGGCSMFDDMLLSGASVTAGIGPGVEAAIEMAQLPFLQQTKLADLDISGLKLGMASDVASDWLMLEGFVLEIGKGWRRDGDRIDLDFGPEGLMRISAEFITEELPPATADRACRGIAAGYIEGETGCSAREGDVSYEAAATIGGKASRLRQELKVVRPGDFR